MLVKVKRMFFFPLQLHTQSFAAIRGTKDTPGILRENHVGYTSAHFYTGEVR